MCPEKERMMREAKHQVAVYELQDGSRYVMNHLVAVKQYSRSSADQESPLTHELRPEPVLKLAMIYLLQHIMDLSDNSDTNLSDWFHFLWDRTRSIRKDITQQELCSLESVSLVEQCARFHIHCAARLIAEEPQVFDQKINTENLTKCLQSLKYMYHDLNLKLVRCPHEAEFRSYVVLLNLHDANFLWEVKQLRPEIRNSPEVRFAIDVYLAMESSNYVKFFALVRSTTYMNACILLRYFTQVRVKALNIILKAYVARSPVYMSISYLTYILAFEDFEQCAQFLEYYGLVCDRDDDRFVLDRSTFYYPDIPFLMERAINVVEHKRHSSVGEAVYGSQLEAKDVLEKYEPHDSFDENGLLLYRAWTAEDQNYFHPEAKAEARRRQNRASPFPVAADDDENLFKKPTALPPVSPRALSPKPKPVPRATAGSEVKNFFASPPVPSFKDVSETPSNSDNIFGAKKSQASLAPASINIFGGFMGSKANSQSAPKAVSTADTPDALNPAFSFTSPPAPNNNTFFKQPSSDSSFAPVKPSGGFFNSNFVSQPSNNLFGQPIAQSKPPAPPSSIFGGFAAAGESNTSNTNSNSNSSWIQSSLRTPEANIIPTPATPGANQKRFDSIAGIVPLQSAVEVEKKREEEERQRKLKEAEERERNRKAEEEKRRRELTEKEEQRRVIEQAAEKLASNLVEEAVEMEVEGIVEAEVELHRLMEQQMEIIYLEILTETVNENVYQLACEARDVMCKSILEKYFTSWHKFTRKSINQRKIIENSPFWLTSKTIPEMVPGLEVPLQAEALSSMERYVSGEPRKFSLKPALRGSVDVWPNISIPLIEHLHEVKAQRPLTKSKIYWKCIFSLPDSDEDGSGWALGDWLEKAMKRQPNFPRSENAFFAEQKPISHSSTTLNVCIRKLHGAKMLTEAKRTAKEKDFAGTNAVLFFTSAKNLAKARLRLEAIVRETEAYDSVAICVYNSKESHADTIRTGLILDELLGEKISEQCVFFCRDPNAMTTEIAESLHFVATRSSIESDLKMQQIGPLLKECLAEQFWYRIHNSLEQNPTLAAAAHKFSFLRDYHNAAIGRMISMFTPCVDTQNEFPPELRPFVPPQPLGIPLDLEHFPPEWKNCERRYAKIENLLKSLRIRADISFENITELQTLEEKVLRFAQTLIPNRREADKLAYKMIQRILSFLGPQPMDRIELKDKLAEYNWINCISVIAIDLLTFHYNEAANSNQLPEYIIYDIDEYEEYAGSNWWLKMNVEQLRSLTGEVVRDADLHIDELDQQVKRQKIDVSLLAEKEQNEMDAIIAKGFASLEKADRVLRAVDENREISREISKELDLSLYLHDHSTYEMNSLLKSDFEN